ncbi:DUF5906 domain-containing protein [Neobacillus vireti]|uniref:Phage/plasmid primase, P4 family protein n=1 Tax=Neobacillus vireti LMG 21834 TaxID=1131730 RepID=A0AB94IJQ5_9BACI|nr:DUF5906 domain-containing protein [Neobacillus vireti]ETI67264.1 phage/plasmid primase, P4 family protein [Neobacillus vireti LMG 21834]KLT19659.1 hypothetical protein AA980_03450 [Neobacillus vireti]
MEYGKVRASVDSVLPGAKLIQLKGFANGNENYNVAKETITKGYTKEDFQGLSDKQADIRDMGKYWIGAVISMGYIVIDSDNAAEGERIYRLLKGEDISFHAIRTPKGHQFIFKYTGEPFNQSVKWFTTLGVTIDTRNAQKGYIVFPTDNTEGRVIEHVSNKPLDELPHYLIPRRVADSIRDNNTGFIDTFSLNDGSRDVMMTKWRGRFWAWNMNEEQYRESMLLIWKYFIDDKDSFLEQQMEKHIEKGMEFVYTPALKTSNELQTINSGDWWVISDKGSQKFLHYVMADYIAENFNIIRYGDESGILYYYDNNDGFYKMDPHWKLLNWQIRTLDKTLTIQQVKEVATSIYESAPVIKEWHRTHIPLKNGLWDIEKRELVPFTHDVFLDYKINIDWNADAYSGFIDETLNKISNLDVPTRANLEECLGSIISPDLLSRFVWFLFGRTAHNGKSFFLYLISQLLSDNFISTLSPHDVAKSQFKISEMYGKKVNLVDEVGDRAIPDFDKIKLLITGGLATIEFKGKGGFTVKLEVPQVWASNFFPNIKEEGDQVNRRLEIIPFDFNFKNDPNKLADTVAERKASSDQSKEYLLKLAIEGMYRLIENDGNPSPNEKRNQQKEEFKQNNDKLGEWLDTRNIIAADGCYNEIDYMSATEIYKLYTSWCFENDERFPYGKTRFKNEMMKRFNLTCIKKRLIDVKTGKEVGNPVVRYVIKE